MKLGPPEIIIFTKFHEDWTKIVDSLLMAHFERVSFFSPRTLEPLDYVPDNMAAKTKLGTVIKPTFP